MDNEKTSQEEQPNQQRLKGIEARLTVVEQQAQKLDRLVYKLFKRLPKETAPENGAEEAA